MFAEDEICSVRKCLICMSIYIYIMTLSSVCEMAEASFIAVLGGKVIVEVSRRRN
jgi:hypothetical protein